MRTGAVRGLALLVLMMSVGICASFHARPAAAAPDSAVSITMEERQWLAQHDGMIRIGITVIPPQVLRSNGGYEGLSIDYIRLMERRLGCRFLLVPYTTWNEVIAAARERRIDMIFAAQQTPERLRYLLFSEPYIELPNMIVVRKDREGGANLGNMRGWSVATSEGSAVHEFLKREFPGLVLRPVPDELSGLMKVSLGEVDAMVVEISRASYYIEKEGILNLRVAGEAGLVYRLRFAVRNDWPVLRGILNKGLAALTAEERREINRRWIIVGERTLFMNRVFLISLATVLGVIALAITASFVWTRTLRNMVRQRTAKLQQELTERRRVEEALQRERSLISRITETSPVGITMVSREGLVTFANRLAENMLGMTKDEITKRAYNAPQWRITDFDGAPFPDEKLPFRQVLASRQPVFDVRHAIEWPDGRRVHLSVNGAPLLNEAGEIESVVFAMEDVTRRSQAEQALRESEQKYRDIFDNVLDGLCLLEVTGDGRFRTLEINPALERSTGIPRSRVIGKTQEEAIAPDVAELVNAKYRRCIEAGRPVEEEAVLELPAGARYCHSTLIPLRDERGRVHRIIGISRDITERRQAEERLALLNFALNNVRDEAYLITGQARFEYVNEQACRALGFTREELLGSMGVADVDPDFPAGRWSEHWRELRERGALIFEGRHRAKDGRIYPVEISANYFEYGGRGYNLALARDITERKRIESALRASERNMALLVMQTPLGVIEWDLEFKVAKWNPAAERIFGYSRDEALGRHASLIVPPAAGDHVDRIWRALVEQKGGVRSTNENVTKGGGSIYCEWYNTPLVNDEGSVIAVASMVQDVTERKKAEESLRKLTEELDLRVRKRTAELETKIVEIERLNKIFVGRELRMVELKEKIAKLEKAANDASGT